LAKRAGAAAPRTRATIGLLPILVVAVPEFRFSEWLSFCRGMGVKLPCRNGSLQSWWKVMILGQQPAGQRQASVCELSK
jgi:hypothetical protein